MIHEYSEIQWYSLVTCSMFVITYFSFLYIQKFSACYKNIIKCEKRQNILNEDLSQYILETNV